MFGNPWLDRIASAVFALVAILSLARLTMSWRDAGQDGRAGAAAHATMATGMAAMAVPAADPLPRWGWLIAFGVVAAWFAVLLARLGPASGPAGLAMGRRAWWSRAGPAAHHLAASLVMLVAVAAGHGAHPVAVPLPADAHHGHGVALPGPSGTAAVLPAPLAWLLSAGFLVLAAWWTVDLLRGIGRASTVTTPSGLAGVRATLTAPALASGCAIVMAAGMGAMALMLG